MSTRHEDRTVAPCYRLRGRLHKGEHTFLLPPREHRIGRADVNDLVLPITGVSRRHALLTCGAESSGPPRFEVKDLNSRNGTFVNGEQVTRREVHPGDTVRFGPVELRLEEIEAGDAELAVVLRPSPTAPSGAPCDRSTAYAAPVASEPAAPKLTFPEGCVLGRSAAMGRLYRDMEALLGADLPVLIEGETGVGKESIARTLHLSSRRREGPFVAVNCAAIPSDLLEAEMFGIGDRVATGVKKRPGKFRDAEGGTLLLDEIAELPVELQAKLLRALQEKEVQPLGGRSVPVDVWVVSATNMDLKGRMEKGGFRRDLYYRVAGSVLRVPPLRERIDDVAPLVEHFLRAMGEKSIPGMTVKTLDALLAYPWPGNVRELEHEVHQLAHRCGEGQAIESSLLSPHLLSPPVHGEVPEEPPRRSEAEVELAAPSGSLRLADHVEATERRIILEAIERADGNQRKAARLLGISRATFARKIEKFGISIRSGAVFSNRD